MALFKILRGPSSGLDKLTINDGWCYYTPDTGLFHIDYNGTRVPLNAKDAQTLSGASLVQVLNGGDLDKKIPSAAAVDEIKENLELLISAKQEHITGTEGQIVVIGANGNPTAINADLSITGGIIDQNTGEIIKMWHGTVEEYDAIAEKDDNTIYILTDEVGGDIVANDIEYDNSISGLIATNVQNAIDELSIASEKELFIVHFSRNSENNQYTADKDQLEIDTALDEGKIVIGVDDIGYYILIGDLRRRGYDNTYSFVHADDSNGYFERYEMYGGGVLYTQTEFASKQYVDETIETEVAALVGSAPETLDTIEELATALNNNKDIVTVLNDSIATKANKTEVYTKAEVDALLANYYTKAQVDAAIAAAIDEAFANIVRAESTSF